ncbi:MAG: SMP-30/gluconolactonase/LRE family protein [Deltaproteobacteria bacterium]|nr:SMP-30/gluconolactonase/LRE family protein [Deltaproteobacteria bacterium]
MRLPTLLLGGAAVTTVAAASYLAFAPTPVDPIAWEAPGNPGLTGAFAPNDRLAAAVMLALPEGLSGPEDVAVDDRGRIHTATAEGKIVRFRPDRTGPEVLATTGGRPLGLDFDASGNLMVADAERGLLSVSPDGVVTELAREADGEPIRYADDVDCAADGRVFFSDATARFAPAESGGTLHASVLDMMEHRRTGRLLVWDPATRRATTALRGISFANGVAVSPDQRFVLVAETGEYRIRRLWLSGPDAGKDDVFVAELPGFPDNVSAGAGRFWVGLVSPRNALLDSLAPYPGIRRVAGRLPERLQPKAVPYSHVVALSPEGQVRGTLQDPSARLPMVTGIVEAGGALHVTSLAGGSFGRLLGAAAAF